MLSSAGAPGELGIGDDGERRPSSTTAGRASRSRSPRRRSAIVAVTGAPAVGSEEHQLLLHLLSLGALSLDKALLHEQSREQARHDSLTGLLGHRVFHEVLEQR